MKIITIILLLAGAILALKTGIAKTELNECKEWQQQANDYPNFYSTAWQKQQCTNYQISLIK